jgi:hypothetical protein
LSMLVDALFRSTGRHQRMRKRRVLDELLAEARRFLEAADKEMVPEKKRKLASAGLALSELAERLERRVAVTDEQIRRCRDMLGHALDDDQRKALDRLLDED